MVISGTTVRMPKSDKEGDDIMRKKQRFILALLAVILVLSGAGYLIYRNSAPDNYPYEPDTPAPDPHDGMFVSAHGSMAFNGDGESVTINFDEELAGLLGLPSGEQSGKYVFLSGELPPQGSIPVRYDVAHELRLTIGDQSVTVDMGIAAADGSSAQVGVGTVTPERIPMLFYDGKSFDIVFNKQK